MIEQGIYPDLDIEVYHGDKESYSRSSLMDFQVSPFYYYQRHLNPDRPDKNITKPMHFGSAAHTLILEPHKFDDLYVVEPKAVLLKDVGREAYDAYKAEVAKLESSGKTVLKNDVWERLQSIKSILQADKSVQILLDGAQIEHSYFWRDPHTNLMMKARPDILRPNLIADLKTTKDVSPRAFQRELYNYGYHIQAAMCREAVEMITGIRINAFYFIVVESEYPFQHGLYRLDESAIDEGYRTYKQLILDLKHAIVNNTFPSYGVQSISLPAWVN